MRIPIVLLIALALSSLNAQAQWYDRKSGTAVIDTKSLKSSGDIGVALILTADADSFIKEWTSTPEAHAPQIPAKGRLKHGDSVWALVFFTACGDERTRCDGTIDFRVLRPDGSTYGEMLGRPVSPTQLTPKTGIVYLSQSYLQIRIEPQDPVGTYKVSAAFKRSDAASPIQLEGEFEVVP